MAGENVTVKFGADINGFLSGVSKVNSALGDFSDFAGKAAKGLGILAAVGGIGKIAKDLTEVALAAGHQAEELSNASQALGVSTSALQDWDVMLNRVGVSQQELQTGLRTLAQKVEDARNGVGDAADRFRQMGVDINKLHSTEDIFIALAENSSKMANGMEKGAAMTDLLSRAGQRLIPAFEGGAKAIEDARQKSEAMTKLSGLQLATLNSMDESVDDLSKAWQRFGQQLGAFVAPTITAVSDAMGWLISVGARALKAMDTAADTLAIRFTHLALAVNEAASVLFSKNVFSADAWKQALANIKQIDAEAAKLIAKRRELDGQSDTKDTRSQPPPMQNTAGLLAHKQAMLDAELKIFQQNLKDREALEKATDDQILAQFESYAQRFLATEVDLAEASAKVTEHRAARAVEAIGAEIVAYDRYVQGRLRSFGKDEKAQQERDKFLKESAAQEESLWARLEVALTGLDTARIQSATQVAKAKQDQATKEADAGFASFQLQAQATEREKQLYLDRANAHLQMVQAQEQALDDQFQDHRRILDATVAAIDAAEAKEVASVKLTEDQIQVIRDQYRAQRLQAENAFKQKMDNLRKGELSDAAALANAQGNLIKAQQDLQFTLFRDTESLRRAKQDALIASAQAELEASEMSATKRLAIETNLQAQLLQVAQQYPTFWQSQLMLIQQSAAFTWSSITSSFSSAMAGVIQGTATMAQFWQQVMNTLLQAVIQLVIQLMAQWALATLFKGEQDKTQATSHLAMETAKTKVTAAQEAARAVIAKAAMASVAASSFAYLAAIVGVGTASLLVAEAVVAAITAVLAAAAKAAAVIPGGQALAGALLTASFILGGAGSAAITTGMAGIQGAAGAAILALGKAMGSAGIPAMAAGGVVTGPTVALIGEAGPEAVIPLSRMGSMGREPVTQHITVELNGRTIAEAVAEDLPSWFHMQGLATA